jgi:hypothetical protein
VMNGDGNGDNFWDGTTTTLRPNVISNSSGESVLNYAIRTILSKQFSVVLNLHGFEQNGNNLGIALEGQRSGISQPQAASNFATIWSNLAGAIAAASRSNPNLYFEVLNEPRFYGSVQGRIWDKTQGLAIKTLRDAGYTNTIVASGNAASNIVPENDYNIFKDVRPSGYSNVVYTFHYYDSFQYTHSGSFAERENGLIEAWFHDLVYPWSRSGNPSVDMRSSAKTDLERWLDIDPSTNVVRPNSSSNSYANPWDRADFINYLNYFQNLGQQAFPYGVQLQREKTDLYGNPTGESDANGNKVLEWVSKERVAFERLNSYYFYRIVPTAAGQTFGRANIDFRIGSAKATFVPWGLVDSNNQPAAWCGEYGAVRHAGMTDNSTAGVARRYYFADVRDMLSKHGFGGSVWGYDDRVAFGIGLPNIPTGIVSLPSDSSFSLDLSLISVVFGIPNPIL